MIFNGKSEAKKIYSRIKKSLENNDVKPSLAIIRTTTNSNQIKYTELKQRQASKLGITADIFSLMDNPTTQKVIEKIKDCSKYTGILVQLPLESTLDKYAILNSIPYEQDVEGLSSRRIGELLQGIPDIYSPAAHAAILSIKKAEDLDFIKIKGSKSVIIGNSYFTGMSTSLALSHLGSTVTACDIYTPDINEYTKTADIIVSCTGKRNLIEPDMVKNDSIVIDVGFDQDSTGRVYGDTNPDIKQKASLYTPVPGGIGPLTVALIFSNLLELQKYQNPY